MPRAAKEQQKCLPLLLKAFPVVEPVRSAMPRQSAHHRAPQRTPFSRVRGGREALILSFSLVNCVTAFVHTLPVASNLRVAGKARDTLASHSPTQGTLASWATFRQRLYPLPAAWMRGGNDLNRLTSLRMTSTAPHGTRAGKFLRMHVQLMCVLCLCVRYLCHSLLRVEITTPQQASISLRFRPCS